MACVLSLANSVCMDNIFIVFKNKLFKQMPTDDFPSSEKRETDEEAASQRMGGRKMASPIPRRGSQHLYQEIPSHPSCDALA